MTKFFVWNSLFNALLYMTKILHLQKSTNVMMSKNKFYLQTMLLPTTAWGTQFPLIPFDHISDQQYQIVGNNKGTIMHINGMQYKLNVDGCLSINVSGPAMLTSNFPIQLIQIGQV